MLTTKKAQNTTEKLVTIIYAGRMIIPTQLSQIDTYVVADAITLLKPDFLDVYVEASEPIRIKLENCEVEEYRYSDSFSDWLVIYPADSRWFSTTNEQSSAFGLQGQIRRISLFHSSTDYFTNYDAHLAYVFCVGPQQLHIGCGKAYIEKNDGQIVTELDSEFITLIERSGQTSYSFDSDYLIYDENKDSENRPYLLNIGTANQTEPIHVNLLFSGGKINADCISSFQSSLTGDLTITYTPTPQKYNLTDQELKLESVMKPKSDLFLSYDMSEYSGKIYGYITDGEVVKMPLFPSFRTWYFSNAYLAPTTIITVVVSAISIFNKKKEGKKEK